MDRAAGKPAVQPSQEVCPRCLRPVESQSPRCENCGQPISRHRSLTLWIGAGGVGALLFLVILMWMVVHDEDVLNAPLPADQQSQQEEVLPDTASQAAKSAEPAKPEKQPPLNK